MSHSVLIVEDEPPARAKLKRFLATLPEFQVVAEADTVEAAVAAIKTHEPNVVYLDIQLGDRSGFEVLEAIRGVVSPHIVFTTAYSEYAVRAFDVQALDYLLKPFDRERFLRSVDRVKDALTDPDHGDLEERIRRVLAAMPGQPAPVKQILIRDKSRAYFVAVVTEHLSPGLFLGRIHLWVDPEDVISGLIKSAVFGLIIALVACYKGFNTTGGSKGVGRATNQAVVTGSVAVLVIDYFLSLALMGYVSKS